MTNVITIKVVMGNKQTSGFVQLSAVAVESQGCVIAWQKF